MTMNIKSPSVQYSFRVKSIGSLSFRLIDHIGIEFDYVNYVVDLPSFYFQWNSSLNMFHLESLWNHLRLRWGSASEVFRL